MRPSVSVCIDSFNYGRFLPEAIESDQENPGVFLKARKPEQFIEKDTRQHALFSITTRREALAVSDAQMAAFHRRGKLQRILRKPERSLRRWRDKFRS